MSDPYEVLGIARGADEAEVRRRYLELVRQFPPEREPQRFAAVRQAYEQLRDPATRLETQLFETRTDDTFDAIRAALHKRLRTARIPVKTLLALAERR